MDEDKDIKIEFICIKNDNILLNNEKKLPTIYIKESYYSIENIEYYLNMYLNSNISNLNKIKDNLYSFDVDKDIKDFKYFLIDDIDDKEIIDLIKN